MAFQSDAGGESKVILEHIFESTRLMMIRGKTEKVCMRQMRDFSYMGFVCYLCLKNIEIN